MKRFFVTAGICAVIVAALKVLSLFDFGYRELIYTGVSIVLFVAGGFVLRLFCPKMKLKKFFRLNNLHKGDMRIFIHMTFLVISGGFLLNFLAITVFDKLGMGIPSGSFAAFDPEEFWLSVLTVAVVPAVFEELFFRGAVISVLSDNKPFVGILLSSFFFAAAHGSLYYFFSNLFAGFIFSLMIGITGSVYISILAHFFNNILSYMLFVYSSRMTTVGFNSVVVWMLMLIFLISLYNTVGTVASRYKERLENERPLINEGGLKWEKRKEGKS